MTVLNTTIANPNLLESDSEISVHFQTADVIRKQNEISQMMDSAQPDFDRIKSEIFRLAQMKYDCCTYNESPQKTGINITSCELRRTAEYQLNKRNSRIHIRFRLLTTLI